MARRQTEALTRVALVMLENLHAPHYGYQLHKAAHVSSGSLYPILRRMVEDGWATSDWETSDDGSDCRPRRCYVLTATGRTKLAEIRQAAEHDPRYSFLLARSEPHSSAFVDSPTASRQDLIRAINQGALKAEFDEAVHCDPELSV
jgi:PadR family transcriptional regulator PadR